MGRIIGALRDALHRIGMWFVDECDAELVGRALNVALAIPVAVIVAGTGYLGIVTGIRKLRGADVGTQLEALLLLTFIIVAIAAVIAIIPTLLYSLTQVVGWWTNLFRFIAFVVLVFLIAVVAPFGLGGGDEAEDGDGEPVGLVPEPPYLLPPDIAEIRHAAIAQQYRRIISARDDGIAQRYRQVKQWRPLVERYAIVAGLDPTRVEAVMMQESAGQPWVTSSARARGLLQVLDSVARERAGTCGLTNIPADSYDPAKNICVGVAQLRWLFAEKFPRDWENSLAAYNWGIGSFSAALGRLQGISPNSPASFWALWDKVDAARGRPLLWNSGVNPNETRHYVPSVLAWEYIIRYFDQYGRPPGRGDRESRPLLASRDQWRDESRSAPLAYGGWWPTVPAAMGWLPPPPQSNVWYTARAGENFGSIVVNLLREDPSAIASLNPDIVAVGLMVTPGTVIRLPEERYAFHSASSNESYRDIASRYGMTTAELLRLAGRWDDLQMRRSTRRDCPPEGCDDERVLAAVGEQFLVRKR